MAPEVETSFITNYVQSLGERTRHEKKGVKYGFDWIIYNLALNDGLIPFRLSFFRAGQGEILKTKTEPEFGVDQSFLSPDGRFLTIFVLKDEPLTNSKWKEHDFDSDLRAAASPNLQVKELGEVKEVRVILAYNKDDDQAGIQLYSNLVNSFEPSIAGNVARTFERWNLTKLTEKIKERMLTPSLLPQQFYGLFSYICSQFADFRHGSEEWQHQLIPNWKRFLDDLLPDQANERLIREKVV